MKKIYFLLFTVCLTFALHAQQINEFEPNPAGGDPPNSSFELKGTASATFDLWILSLENDGYSGTVDKATNVTGTFDANGLATVTTTDLENPSFTLVLTTDFTGSAGDDLDAMDDGNLDTSSLGTILDAVGVSDATADNTSLYGATLGGANILYNGEFEPLLAFRDGTTGDSYNTVTVDFGDPGEYIGVFDAAGTEVSVANFDSDPTTGPTYGAANPSNSVASTDDFFGSNLKLYPNPTSVGYVKIRTNFGGDISVQVFNVLGKKVINQSVANEHLDVSNLKTGVYIMKISQNSNTATKKLVIK